MNKNRFTARTLASLLAVAALAAATTVQASHSSIADRTLVNDAIALGYGFSALDATTDASGNIHLVAQGRSSSSSSTREIFYFLLSATGAKLIDATQVNVTDANRDGRPQVVALANGRAVITWTPPGFAVTYAVVNPAADDRDGDAANPADPLFLVTAPTVIGVSTSTAHHASAVDANGIVHVVKAESGSLLYLSFNAATGAVVTAETTVASVGSRGPPPDAALDSAGNVHIIFNWDDPVDGYSPVAYMMLNGATGAVMIDATPLYSASGVLQHAAHFSLMVDGNNRVHLVYGDKRFTTDLDSYCNECSSGGDSFYVRLNPALHPRDGSAGTVGQMREGTEAHIGAFWYGRAFRSSDGSINFYSVAGENFVNDGIHHVEIAPTAAGATVGDPRYFQVHAVSANYAKHYVASAGGRAFWTEGSNAPTLGGEVYPIYTAPVASFKARSGGTVVVEEDDGIFGCSLASGRGPVDPTLPLLAVLAALFLLRRRAWLPVR